MCFNVAGSGSPRCLASRRYVYFLFRHKPQVHKDVEQTVLSTLDNVEQRRLSSSFMGPLGECCEFEMWMHFIVDFGQVDILAKRVDEKAGI